MQALVTFAVVTAMAVVLAVPSAVAILRKHPSWIAISIVSIVSGWTVIGWIATLWWACSSTDRPRWRRLRKLATVLSRMKIRRPDGSAERSGRAGANDNAPDRRFSPQEALADIALPDPYETWLERGEALPEEAATAADSRHAGVASLAA